MANIHAEHFISIADANKLGLSALVREAEEGHDYILVRNNKPVAVVMSAERFEKFQESLDDLVDITMAAARTMTSGGRAYTFDEVLERFGYTRDELAVIPDKMPE
jgi:prevent-host-death family protein